MKDKIKKLVALYRDNPTSCEGLSAYGKAKELIKKYGYNDSEFGLNHFLVPYNKPEDKKETFKKFKEKTVETVSNVGRMASAVVRGLFTPVEEPIESYEPVQFRKTEMPMLIRDLTQSIMSYSFKVNEWCEYYKCSVQYLGNHQYFRARLTHFGDTVELIDTYLNYDLEQVVNELDCFKRKLISLIIDEGGGLL
jgi:hypothetical protein